jgi:hypothetical protein
MATAPGSGVDAMASRNGKWDGRQRVANASGHHDKRDTHTQYSAVDDDAAILKQYEAGHALPEDERDLLCRVLWMPSEFADVRHVLRTRDLYVDEVRVAYAALCRIADAGTVAECADWTDVLLDELRTSGELDVPGGVSTSFVYGVTCRTPIYTAQHYADRIHDVAPDRHALRTIHTLYKEGLKHDDPVATLARWHAVTGAALTASDDPPSADARRFPLRSVAELVGLPPVEPLVDGILWRASTFHAFGPPGSGKTVCLEDIGLCVAAGIPWQGHAVHAGHVVFVQNDTPAAAVGEHVHGWLLQHPELTVDDLARFHVVTVHMALLDPATLDTLLREWADELGEPIALVIADSLNTTAAPGSTKDSDDMGQYANVLRRIAVEWGACVGFINHVGWAERDRPRGSTALVGDIDTVLAFQTDKEDAKNGVVKHYRDRLSVAGFSFAYRVESVALDGHHAGRTAPIVVADDLSSEPRRDGPAPSGRELEVYNVMLAILREFEFTCDGVYYGTWLKRCVEAGIPEGTFKSSLQRLQKKGKVERRGVDLVFWPVGDDLQPSPPADVA